MIPRIYDAERVIRIRGEDESISAAKVNGVEQDPETGVQRVINDLTVGKYDVTIAAGPSYTTQRQEAAEAMTQFAQSWPKLMDVAGDAQTLAAASHHAAFNTANALGPWLGGMAITAGFGWTSTGYVGAATAVVGLLIYAWASRTQHATARANIVVGHHDVAACETG